MNFEIVRKIEAVETFASGRSIRELQRLRRIYGAGRWRNRKGFAIMRFPHGMERKAEPHWYEATGTGRKEFKIKRLLDE